MVENTEMRMRIDESTNAVKREYRTAFRPDELANKFSSKKDLLTYLSDHCEYPLLSV